MNNFGNKNMKVETSNDRMENYGSIEGRNHKTKQTQLDEDVEADDSGHEMDDDDHDEEDPEDASYSVADESSSGRKRRQRTQPYWSYIFKQMKSVFIFIFHVDQEVWDSPDVSRKQKVVVIFWLFAFSLGYALERASFKILVDHAGPFRMFAAEAISGLSALILGSTMLVQAIMDKSFKCQSLGFPLADVCDTVQLLLCVISGSKIPPIFVVLLVQMVTPLTMLLTTCFGRDVVAAHDSSSQPEQTSYTTSLRGYTTRQILGATLITMAVFVGLFPAVIEIYYPSSSWTAYNSGCNMFIFLLSCVPAALSTLYKEYTLAEYKLPVSPQYLNFVLAIFQVIFTAIISPLVYPLQGFVQDSNWIDLYPSSDISKNFVDSMQCFVSSIDEEVATSQYAESADCHFIWILLVGYVLSVVVSGMAVDKVIKGGAYNVLYRGLSFGVILAMWSMWYYDKNYSDKSFGEVDKYANVSNSLHLLSITVLIFGQDLYHRDPLSETSFETTYQFVGDVGD